MELYYRQEYNDLLAVNKQFIQTVYGMLFYITWQYVCLSDSRDKSVLTVLHSDWPPLFTACHCFRVINWPPLVTGLCMHIHTCLHKISYNIYHLIWYHVLLSHLRYSHNPLLPHSSSYRIRICIHICIPYHTVVYHNKAYNCQCPIKHAIHCDLTSHDLHIILCIDL